MQRFKCRPGLRFRAAVAAALACAVMAADVPAPAEESVDDLVRARLVAEQPGLKPGATAWLAVALTMKPGWHTYWRNAGDAGMPTQVDWTLPAGYTAGALQWPMPAIFLQGIATSYGYHGEVALLAPLRVPADAQPGQEVAIAAHVQWLACAKICVPGEARVSITLPVAAAPGAADATTATLFRTARAALPHDGTTRTAAAVSEASIALDVPPAALMGIAEPTVAFLPLDDALIDHGSPQRLAGAGGHPVLTLTRGPRLGRLDPEIAGLLVVEDKATHSRQGFMLTAQVAGQ